MKNFFRLKTLFSIQLIGVLISSCTTYKFKNDTAFKYYKPKICTSLKIMPYDNTKNKIQIRLWRRTFDSSYQSVFIISENNFNNWSLNKYEFILSQKDSIINQTNKIVTLSLDWVYFWDSLVKKKFLETKDFAINRKKWKSTKGYEISVSDGVYYVVELLTKKSKRSFAYSNPEDYLFHNDLVNTGLPLLAALIKQVDKISN